MSHFGERVLFRNSRIGRGFGLASALLLVAATLFATPTATAADPGATQCRSVSVEVQVGLQRGPIAGTLCSPPNANTVQVLVHGWTYGQYYFDFPYQPEKYSYVEAANKAGYATLNIDRLGAGASLHPISAFDTFNADARTIHEVIQALRSGSLGAKFDRVIEVGHSLGSLLTAAEAGRYDDVDAMITTGFTHMPNYVNDLTQVIGPSVDYPAIADEKFAKSGLDPAYITSVPGTRKALYDQKNVDPAVLDRDEQLKQTQSLVELADVATYSLLNVDRTWNKPVLTVTGQQDQVLCGFLTADCSSSDSLAAYEKPWYGPQATVEAYAVPGSGHDVQLQENSASTSARMIQFADRYVGRGTGVAGTAPGTRPAIPAAPSGPLDPATAAVNAAFTQAIAPLFATVAGASKIVPGLGTQNTDPTHVGDKLHIIGSLDDQILGTLPQEVLSTL